MSSICVSDLKAILESYPDNAEVIMNIRHKYSISKEEGEQGWISYINAIKYDELMNEVRFMN